MAVRSQTSIFNAALLRTGNDPATEGEGSALWMVLEANYDEIVRACLEEGDGAFEFGRARVALTSRSAGAFGYTDAFSLPSDAIHVIEVFLDGHACADLLQDWDIDGESAKLVIDAGTRKVEMSYVRRGLEHTWSSTFATAVQRKLEAAIKDALEESGEAAAKEEEAAMQLAKAAAKGSKSRNARRVWKKAGGRLLRRRLGI